MAYGKALIALTVFQIVLTTLGGFFILNKSEGIVIPDGMQLVKIGDSGSDGGSQSTRNRVLQSRQAVGAGETSGAAPYQRAAAKSTSTQTSEPAPLDPMALMMAELALKQESDKLAKINLVKGFKFAKSEQDHRCLFAAFFEFKAKHYFELGVLTDETCEDANDFTPLDAGTEPIKSIISDQKAFNERYMGRSTHQFNETVNNNKYVVQFISPTSDKPRKANEDDSFKFVQSVVKFISAHDFSDDSVSKLVNGFRASTDLLKVVVSDKGTVKPAVVVAEGSPVVTATETSSVPTDNVPKPKELRLKEPVKLGFVAALKIGQNLAKTAFQYLAMFKVAEGYFIYFDSYNNPDGEVDFVKLPSPEIVREPVDIELNETKYNAMQVNKNTDAYFKQTIDGLEAFAAKTGFPRTANIDSIFKSIADEIHGDRESAEKVLTALGPQSNRNTSILVVEKKGTETTSA